MVRSIAAVIGGFLAMAFVVGLGTAATSKLLLSQQPDGAVLRPTPVYLVVNLGLSAFAALLGGLTATRLAGRAPMKHAIALASLVLLLALITALTAGGQPAEPQQPPWYPVVLALLGPAAVVLGGWIGLNVNAEPDETRRVD
jgi:hypothetical protein